MTGKNLLALAETPANPVVCDLLGLSSGTLASITGEMDTEKLDAVQAELVLFCAAEPERYETWQDVVTAWKARR